MDNKDFKAFIFLVSRLLTCQKEYFKTKDKNWLFKSKELEKQVQQTIDKYLNLEICYE